MYLTLCRSVLLYYYVFIDKFQMLFVFFRIGFVSGLVPNSPFLNVASIDPILILVAECATMASTNPHVTAHICLQPKILARLLSLPVVQDTCSSLQPLQAPWSSLCESPINSGK